MTREQLPELPEVLKNEIKKYKHSDIVQELKNKLRSANGKIGGLQAKLNKLESNLKGPDVQTVLEHNEKLKTWIDQWKEEVDKRDKTIETLQRKNIEEKEIKNRMIDEKNKELKQYKEGFFFLEAIVKKLIGYKDAS